MKQIASLMNEEDVPAPYDDAYRKQADLTVLCNASTREQLGCPIAVDGRLGLPGAPARDSDIFIIDNVDDFLAGLQGLVVAGQQGPRLSPLGIVADEIEAEYREVLARDKLRRGAPAGAHRIAATIMDALVGVAERVEPAPDVHVIEKDSKDDKSVAAALGGGAAYVVTLDRRHMPALGARKGVRFVTPGDFLAVLRSSSS